LEDYTGLWDAAAEVEKIHPEVSKWQTRRDAAAALSHLAAQRWISLYRCEEPLGRNTLQELPTDQSDSALSVGPHWAPPSVGVTSIRFLTTDSGKAAYESVAAAD
jgi:hypothetical protein